MLRKGYREYRGGPPPVNLRSKGGGGGGAEERWDNPYPTQDESNQLVHVILWCPNALIQEKQLCNKGYLVSVTMTVVGQSYVYVIDYSPDRSSLTGSQNWHTL